MTERWVTKSAAIAMISERCGASDFRSRAMLDQAVADGVRLSVGGVLRSRASITDDQWGWGGMGAEGQRAFDGVGRPIEISEDDLLEWIKEAVPPIEAQAAEASQPIAKSPEVAAPSNGQVERRQPKRERAAEAIRALFDDKVPAMTDLPNVELCRQVGDWLKADCKGRNIRSLTIHDDTILRAAGRAK